MGLSRSKLLTWLAVTTGMGVFAPFRDILARPRQRTTVLTATATRTGECLVDGAPTIAYLLGVRSPAQAHALTESIGAPGSRG